MAGIIVVLLVTALIPVDIFLVAFMKTSDGHFKDWAETNATRAELENGVLYAYYALWLCVLLFVFIFLPFAYFFYEEADEERSSKTRCCSALKYTAVFMFAASVLLVVGAFAPIQHMPLSNATDMERIKFIFEDTRPADALSFCISSLTLIGMIWAVMYTVCCHDSDFL